jgi:hypothetical protein
MGSSFRGCCENSPISHPLGSLAIQVAPFHRIFVGGTREVKRELRRESVWRRSEGIPPSTHVVSLPQGSREDW